MCFEQTVFQPGQALPSDQTFLPACSGQHIGHGTDSARGAVALVPMLSVEQQLGFVQHRFGRNFSGFERGGCPQSVLEILHGPSHAAYPVRLQGGSVFMSAQNHLSRTTTNVDHQASLIGLGQEVGNAQINQPRFFASRNHFDGETQHSFSLGQKLVTVACFAKRLGGHCAHLVWFEAGYPLAKAGQTIPATCHGF